MGSAVSPRVAISLAILLICGVASMRGRVPIPPRIITEVVSITYVPARSILPVTSFQPLAVPGAPAVAVEASPVRSEPLETTLAPHDAPKVLRSKPQPRPGRKPSVQAAAARQGPVMSARAPGGSHLQAGFAKVSCRAPARCAGGATGGSVPPPVPAIFMPMRDLGLRLQARLAGPVPQGACDVPMRSARDRQERASVAAIS